MFRKTIALLLAVLFILSLAACGTSPESTVSEGQEEAGSAETENQSAGTVSSSLAEDEEALIAACTGKFTQETYTDEDTGLSITYNLCLPDGYEESGSYPMVVFIGDSSCTGSDATVSLTQGRGALVWASDEWQSAYPTIVAVPTYPETILDDHGSYTTTEYVELTARYIDYMTSQYAVDQDRIYGTGQSMGCMTTLILASEYPDLYAACMFVDGQWDISTLEGLAEQKFVYFAAEDDTNAWNGMQEVIAMFDESSVSYTYAQWDGTWSTEELSDAAQELFAGGGERYFISWASGTIEPKSGGAGGSGAPSGSFGGPSGSSSGESFQGPSGNGGAGGMSGGTDSSSYHMASFDYAYNCVAVMEWLFRQTR